MGFIIRPNKKLNFKTFSMKQTFIHTIIKNNGKKKFNFFLLDIHILKLNRFVFSWFLFNDGCVDFKMETIYYEDDEIEMKYVAENEMRLSSELLTSLNGRQVVVMTVMEKWLRKTCMAIWIL